MPNVGLPSLLVVHVEKSRLPLVSISEPFHFVLHRAMMSSSKAKKHKQRHSQDAIRFDGLKRKLAQGPFRNREVALGPIDDLKMSDVLLDFIAPYRSAVNATDAYHRLLTLAILAWNASFLSAKEQGEMVERVVDGGLPSESEELRSGLKQIVYEMIERKRTHFSEYRRNILDYELTDTGAEYRLAVASTAEEME